MPFRLNNRNPVDSLPDALLELIRAYSSSEWGCMVANDGTAIRVIRFDVGSGQFSLIEIERVEEK